MANRDDYKGTVGRELLPGAIRATRTFLDALDAVLSLGSNAIQYGEGAGLLMLSSNGGVTPGRSSFAGYGLGGQIVVDLAFLPLNEPFERSRLRVTFHEVLHLGLHEIGIHQHAERGWEGGIGMFESTFLKWLDDTGRTPCDPSE